MLTGYEIDLFKRALSSVEHSRAVGQQLSAMAELSRHLYGSPAFRPCGTRFAVASAFCGWFHDFQSPDWGCENDRMALVIDSMIGQTLNHYKVLAQIGEAEWVSCTRSE